MARIDIKGIIGQDYTFKQFVTDFSAAKDSIRLYIDSVGGSVDEGEQIAEFITKKQERFESVQNTGDVASIASNIFLALPYEKRFFNPSKGVALIHNPYINPKSLKGFDTTAAGLSYLSSEMQASEDRMASEISRQTGLDIDVVRALMMINEPLTEEQLESINFAQIMRFQAVAFLKTENIMEKEDVQTMITESHDTLWNRFIALFNRRTNFVAVMMTDANGAQIEFPDVPEGTTPQIGDTARMADGGLPSGEVVMASGETYVFEAGVLKEIRPVQEEPEMEDLQARITELERTNAELTAQITKAETEKTDLRAQIRSQMIEPEPVEKPEPVMEKNRMTELQEMKEKTTSKNR